LGNDFWVNHAWMSIVVKNTNPGLSMHWQTLNFATQLRNNESFIDKHYQKLPCYKAN
jgi:hypothetical protein